ncbi:hypothetical protein J6590_082862 [Homalodisca vitripennis]|nr:hypothetical protein J6590_082862 [Homalodisca vitripennis]
MNNEMNDGDFGNRLLDEPESSQQADDYAQDEVMEEHSDASSQDIFGYDLDADPEYFPRDDEVYKSVDKSVEKEQISQIELIFQLTKIKQLQYIVDRDDQYGLKTTVAYSRMGHRIILKRKTMEWTDRQPHRKKPKSRFALLHTASMW